MEYPELLGIFEILRILRILRKLRILRILKIITILRKPGILKILTILGYLVCWNTWIIIVVHGTLGISTILEILCSEFIMVRIVTLGDTMLLEY